MYETQISRRWVLGWYPHYRKWHIGKCRACDYDADWEMCLGKLHLFRKKVRN